MLAALLPLLMAAVVPARAQSRAEGRYPEFYSMVVASATIPGLRRGAVPQGVAWSPRDGAAIVSFYTAKGARLATVDMLSGARTAGAALQDPGGRPLRSHAGGVAVARGRVWLSSKGALARFPLRDWLDGRRRALRAEAQFNVQTKASYVSADGDGLWVGDFRKKKEGFQPYAAYYPLDVEARPASTPTRFWAIPDRVQGLAVCSGFVALSRSAGPRDSVLELHRPPPDGGRLDQTTLLRSVTLPAGSEDLECAEGRLLILFESGAGKYRDKWLGKGAGLEDRVFALTLQPAY